MFRVSATLKSNSDLYIWLFDDHSEDLDGDHNYVPAWQDLLESASAVTVQWRRVTSDTDGNVISVTAWQMFVVSMGRFLGPKKAIKGSVNAIRDGNEYQAQFSINGGPWLGPISFRFMR